MQVSRFGNVSELHFGTDVGELRVYVDSSEQEFDAGTPTEIVSSLDLRAFQFGDPISPKSLLNVELEFQSSTANINLEISADDGSNELIAAGIATGVALLTLPFTLPAVLSDGGHVRSAFGLLRFRRIRQAQPLLTSASGRMAIRACTMSAFVETIQIDT
jgi:hypothetical protein